jgi:hypothetical protein
MKSLHKKNVSQGKRRSFEFCLGGFAALLGIPNDHFFKFEWSEYNSIEESSSDQRDAEKLHRDI